MKLRRLLLPISVSFLFSIASASAGDRLTRSQIPADLVQWLIKDINNSFPMDAEELEDLNKNLKCKLYDLNGDGVPEYLLYIDSCAWCGAGGCACNYWVVQRTLKGYRLLLEATEIRVQQGAVTNGYRDLTSENVIGYTSGGWAREIVVTDYKFDGERYRAGREYSEFRR